MSVDICKRIEDLVFELLESNITIHSAHRTAKLLIVLEHLYGINYKKQSTTQREVYYCLIRHFDDQMVLNTTLQHICTMMQVHRRDLGVFAAARGMISARNLVIHSNNRTSQQIINSPQSISNELTRDTCEYESDAKFILGKCYLNRMV